MTRSVDTTPSTTLSLATVNSAAIPTPASQHHLAAQLPPASAGGSLPHPHPQPHSSASGAAPPPGGDARALGRSPLAGATSATGPLGSPANSVGLPPGAHAPPHHHTHHHHHHHHSSSSSRHARAGPHAPGPSQLSVQAHHSAPGVGAGAAGGGGAGAVGSSVEFGYAKQIGDLYVWGQMARFDDSARTTAPPVREALLWGTVRLAVQARRSLARSAAQCLLARGWLVLA